jgi:transposase
MLATAEIKPRRQKLTAKRIAPALVVLARGAYAREAAEPAGVSIATVLNWMDWAWKHRDEVDAYLREHYPDLSQAQVIHLWKRIERRQAKRRRRRDFTDWRSGR